MINKISFAVSTALAASVAPNVTFANVTDISVESQHNNLTVTAHKTQTHESFEYRLKYTSSDSTNTVTTPWQSSNKFSIAAKHGKLYKVTLEAMNLSTGDIVSLSENNVSLANTQRVVPVASKTAVYLSRESASSTSEGAWLNDFVVDIDAFPLINITSDLIYNGKPFDGSAENLPLLSSSNIEVREDGRYENITRFVQPDPNSSRKIVDIVFVHDDSGSLNDEAASVRANILNFVQGLSDENFDYRIGLVPYGGGGSYYSFSGPSGTLLDNGSLTSDPSKFQDYIDQMRFDGGTERAFDAIKLAANGILWRPSTQKVVVLVTDENNDYGSTSESEATQSLVANNILFYGLTAGHDEFDRIAAATSGKVFDVRSDFSSILSEIGADLSSRYQTQYETDNPNLDGVERVINFSVAASDNQANPVEGEFELRYTPQLPVSLELTSATQALMNSGQLPSKPLPIRVVAGSEVAISGMNLGYRHDSASGYSLVGMTQSSDGSWYAEIPETVVQQGAVNFYISAVTDIGVKTLPAADPQESPFIVTVLPNVPPEFQHTPVAVADEGIDVVIEASAEDATNEVASISLFYRQIGAPLYTEVTQAFNVPQANFSATLPGTEVTRQGIEYYLVAKDDFGSEVFSGSPETPYQITVGTDEIPGGCNDYASIMICADDFVSSDDSTEVLASGNVHIGATGGAPVLGFSGAVTIDTVTSEVQTIGMGRLTALDMLVSYATAKDIPLGTMSFSIDGNLGSPELTPIHVFDYSLNGILLSGRKVTIGSSQIKVDTTMTLPLMNNYALPLEETRNPLSLGDFVLSQSSGGSSLEMTFVMKDLLGDNPSRRVGKFGSSGLSVELDTLTLDFLSPAVKLNGAANWNQSQYGLGVGVGLNPVSINAFEFSYKNYKRTSFATAKKIPLGTTGFVIAHKGTSLKWNRTPSAAVGGSISGYFSDALGGMAAAGNTAGADLLSGSLGVTINNMGKTWAASGRLSLLERFPLASTNLTAGMLSSGQYGANLTGNINLADIITGTALFNAQSGSRFTQLRSKTDLNVQLPRKIPFVGGTRLAGKSAELLFRTDHTNNNDLTAYFQSLVKLGSIDLGVRVDFSDPKDIDFDLVKKSSVSTPVATFSTNGVANEDLSFTLPEGEAAVLFGAITDSGLPDIELVLPSGEVLKAADMLITLGDPGNDTLSQFAFTNGDNQTVIGLQAPIGGDYTLRVVNSADLTSLETNMVIPKTPPVASLSNIPASLNTGDTLSFELEISNIDGPAIAEIQLRDEAETIELTLDEVAVTPGANTLSVALPAGVNSDDFYVVGVVRYDNMTVETTSSNKLSVENTAAPDAPSNVAATFNNGSTTVSWDKSSTADVDAYFIKVVNESRDTSSVVAVSGALDSFELENLTNGDNYTISVAASVEEGLRSNFAGNVYGSPVGTFVSGFADVGFANASVEVSSETEVRGEPIKVTATIENSGDFTAYSSRLNCYYGEVSDASLVNSTLIGNLAPGATLAVSCDIDQTQFDDIGNEVYVTITDVQLPDNKLANNHAVAENPFSKNVAPVGISDDIALDEDTTKVLDVITNDTDDNGDTLSIESFTQPSFGSVEANNGVLTYIPDSNYYGMDSFTYVVSDGELSSEETLVTLDVLPVNDAPIIAPIASSQVSEGKSTTITAQASDIDSDTLTYSWAQTGGTEVVISGETTSAINIQAPYVSEESQLTFVLSVSDGELTTDSLVEVTLLNDNNPPELSIEAPAEVNEGATVEVVASYSDVDNDELTVEWKQTSGPQVDIAQVEGTTLTFDAPEVSADETFTFEVSVADGEHTITESVSVVVRNVEVTPPPSAKSSGGGSTGVWFGSLGLLALLGRRFKRK
ncbi:tandem-95 repeat protein [Alteromonas sp. 345S023]|uniref:Tandem-95 repeat protein n=1 Tax=Alteromonas profundi TaxID=2696062 RepID=A0A7X5LMN3_9ALTE|nr:tandem-95 repeat protein [Alteromonas profundi]NDV92213.1 tandem-95 repeat protein [Alteromonas profundi]